MVAITRSSAALIFVTCVAHASSSQAAVRLNPRPDASIQSVRVAAGDDTTTVVIETNSVLPRPTVGVLDGPPRIYFDFAGLLASTRGTEETGDRFVRRVRVALYSAAPRVTRVVIDLVSPVAYRIDTGASSPARLVVLVGGRYGSAAPASAPVVATPTGGVYLRHVKELLARLERIRPLLVSIDRRTEQVPTGIQVAALELASIEQALAALKPSPRLAAAHDRLVQSCTLASQALKAHMQVSVTNAPAGGWTAASAAAGALLLLDRAREDFGLKPATDER